MPRRVLERRAIDFGSHVFAVKYAKSLTLVNYEHFCGEHERDATQPAGRMFRAPLYQVEERAAPRRRTFLKEITHNFTSFVTSLTTFITRDSSRDARRDI